MKALAELTPADVKSVYVGENGACCCGCSGTHTYLAANREAASKGRGYEVADDEIDDLIVEQVLHKLKTPDIPIEVGSNNYSAVFGTRVYIVYPLVV